MLKNKHFWVGFLAAYVLSMFLPLSKITGGLKKKGS